MRFIIIQVSPRRWVVAERDGAASSRFYTICTTKIKTRQEASIVRTELLNLDTEDYSTITKDVLLF